MYKKGQLQNAAVHQDIDHFHWPAEFPEVFVPSCKQPICGFEVVIVNAPWRKVRGMGAREEEGEQQRAEGKTFLVDVSSHECYGLEISEIRQPDFFEYFIGRGLQLHKESQEQHAFLDFVVPACLSETKDLEKLRMHLRRQHQVKEVYSFGQYAVWKDVQLFCCVFLLPKGAQQPENDSHEIQYFPSLH